MCNKLHVHTDFSKEESFNRQKTFYVKLMPTISPLNLIHIYQVHAIPNNNPTLQQYKIKVNPNKTVKNQEDENARLIINYKTFIQKSHKKSIEQYSFGFEPAIK